MTKQLKIILSLVLLAVIIVGGYFVIIYFNELGNRKLDLFI